MGRPRFDTHSPEGIADAVLELFVEAQMKRMPVKTVPNKAELQEGEIMPYDDGTDQRLYVKLNGALYYVALTAV